MNSSFFSIVVLALFGFCISSPHHNNIRCIEEERNALLIFKNNLVDETSILASWVADDKECCKWVGISCDNSTGHVHAIRLRGLDGKCTVDDYIYEGNTEKNEILKRRLEGDISPSLLDLKNLKYLDLSCNKFKGTQIPNSIGSLQNLRYLNLSYSKFSGSIPPQIGNLSELRILSLGGDQYEPNYEYIYEKTTMNIECLTGLRFLRHLDLSNMNLTKTIGLFGLINRLPSLVQLRLSSSILPQTYVSTPTPTPNLTSLSFLDLSHSVFDSQVATQWISSLTSLVSLNLAWCDIRLVTPSTTYMFRNLTSLKYVQIKRNYFMNSLLVLKEMSHSRIISLDMSVCNISTSVLNSLQNLTSLRRLNVAHNRLTKRLPESLGNLCDLREINLSGNTFVDRNFTYLVETFLDCKSPALESLSMMASDLNGTITPSIGHLSFLKRLNIELNELSGPIPHTIGQLSSLEGLFLSYNNLNGSLPRSLGKLSKLRKLHFDNNFLTGVVTQAHFQKLVSLKMLTGSGNNLILRLPNEKWIPPFDAKLLCFNSWVLGPQFPLWLQSQKDLKDLEIVNTSISSPMPESFIRSFPNIRYLDMSLNSIKGVLPFFSGIPTTLNVLDISFNEFFGPLDDFLCSNNVTDVIYLNLGNNNLSGVIPECWEKWPNMEVFISDNNSLSGEIPGALLSLPLLTILNMKGNKFSGELPASVTNVQANFRSLQLGRNELVGSIPTWIGTKLSCLKYLNLRHNKFNGNIPDELCDLVHVQIIDLAQNNLSGDIPRCFNNLSILSGQGKDLDVSFPSPRDYGPSIVSGETLVIKGREETYTDSPIFETLLDLSCNNLVGEIPSELTALRELRSLNLSRNKLAGKIPEKIGDMKALESFDLSVNKLSGKLPWSLSKLNFLCSFNISYNNFTGKIPSSTQMQSFNESSFFGNKLCGPPITKVDDCVAAKTLGDADDDMKEDDGSHWVIVCIVILFVVGFFIIMASLIKRRIR